MINQSEYTTPQQYQKHCTLSEFLEVHGSLQWDITGKMLFIRGRLHGSDTWVYARISIHGCLKRAFVGQHLVEIIESAGPHMNVKGPFWVHSTTSLKKHFLGFDDKISFERSTYLQLGDKFFALNDIRPYLTLARESPKPAVDMIYTNPTKCHPYRIRKHRVQQQATNSMLRSQKLLHRSIQKVVSSYHRDMDDNVEPFIEDVCAKVGADVQDELDLFMKKIEQTAALDELR